jgi:hypothetical protein
MEEFGKSGSLEYSPVPRFTMLRHRTNSTYVAQGTFSMNIEWNILALVSRRTFVLFFRISRYSSLVWSII